MMAIYKRELKSYFQTMIGNVFLAFLIAFVGFYFMVYNLYYGYNYFSYALGSGLLIMIIAVPILTMKSFAEERRSKTDQLLLTAPVKLWEIVLGKYLSMISILAIACLIFCICPIIILTLGSAHLTIDYLTILLFFLIGSLYIALGMLISSLTESQIIAAIGTMGILLLLYFWSSLSAYLPTIGFYNLIAILLLLAVAALVLFSYLGSGLFSGLFFLATGIIAVVIYVINGTAYESLLSNLLAGFDLTSILYNSVDSNLFSVPNLVFLLSLIGLFNFLTLQVLQKRRWS
ncbi:ABC transporter permease [Enterococcus sp. LJL120]